MIRAQQLEKKAFHLRAYFLCRLMPESPEAVNAERTVCLLLGFLSVITAQACIPAKDLR